MSDQLALEGGSPISEESVPYHRPSVGRDEVEEIKKSIDSNWIAGPGPYSEKIENKIEDEWSVERALTVTSCTHGMELALLALELEPEDEVIVPSFTYVSTALAVLRAGARPVFADVEPETQCLSPATIEDALTERTAAVLMVHYGGYPGPVASVAEYCADRDLHLIEDAAQVFDTAWQDQHAGTFGELGVFSFHATKSLTCGEGGLVLVNDPEYVKSCEMIRDKGTDRSTTHLGDVDRYTWRSVGSSYVLSDILAAMLWRQLERWPRLKKRRLEVQESVRTAVREVDSENILEVLTPADEARENGHITAFMLKRGATHRDWLLKALQAEGIEAREHYHPLHLSPFAREELSPPESLPGAQRVSNSLIRLPAFPDLSADQVNKIKFALQKVYPHLIEKVF